MNASISKLINTGRVTLSVVIPLYNESAMLALLHARLRTVLDALNLSYEIVLVDDGSRDATADMLRDLAAADPAIRAVLLSRNFGKEAALTAGLDHAMGDAVVVMDADLQDPPELIAQMLHAWQGGADVVCMRRRTRAGEGWLKRASAHGFYRLLNAISAVDIPADTGDFRLLSRKAVEALKRLDERNRYMKGLFAWIGLPTQVIFYDRAPRAAGASKWGWFKLLGLAFEGITSFSTAPLRLATIAGLCTVAFGVGFAVWIAAKALITSDPVPGYPSLICMITILGGAQLLSVGLLGEYLGKTYHEVKRRPIYLVEDVVGHAAMQTTREADPLPPLRSALAHKREKENADNAPRPLAAEEPGERVGFAVDLVARHG